MKKVKILGFESIIAAVGHSFCYMEFGISNRKVLYVFYTILILYKPKYLIPSNVNSQKCTYQINRFIKAQKALFLSNMKTFKHTMKCVQRELIKGDKMKTTFLRILRLNTLFEHIKKYHLQWLTYIAWYLINARLYTLTQNSRHFGNHADNYLLNVIFSLQLGLQAWQDHVFYTYVYSMNNILWKPYYSTQHSRVNKTC